MKPHLLSPAVLVLALAPLLFAQEGAPAPVELPAARAILDRFAAETGLARKLAETKSAHLVGRASIPAMQREGRFERWAARPDRTLVRIELEGYGTILSGYDGKTGWRIDPSMGPQIQTGVELLQARAESAWEASLRPASAYDSIATTARKKFAGEDCWEVRYVLAPAEGMDPEATRKLRTSYEYYAVESGHLLGLRATSAMPTGPLDVVVKYSKYAQLGGVLQATVMTQEAAGSQLVVTLTSLEYDDVDPQVFALPEAIAAQLAAQAPPKPPADPPDGGDGDDGGAPR